MPGLTMPMGLGRGLTCSTMDPSASSFTMMPMHPGVCCITDVSAVTGAGSDIDSLIHGIENAMNAQQTHMAALQSAITGHEQTIEGLAAFLADHTETELTAQLVEGAQLMTQISGILEFIIRLRDNAGCLTELDGQQKLAVTFLAQISDATGE